MAPVVSGVAAVTPLGRTLEATAEAVAAGRSAIAFVEGLQSPAARIGAFTTEPEMARAKARRMDRGSQYAVVAALQCLLDAGYTMEGHEERTGILVATGSAGAGPLTEMERQMAAESPEAASPFLFPYTVANAPASLVALELKIKGPNVTIIQKDPGPLNALLYGRLMLADHRADALLVGAADEWNAIYHEAYERVRATRTATRPGFALGEGASLVLLEREESVTARGGRVRARLSGLAMRTLAITPHRRRATPEILAETMCAALSEAGIAASAVSVVHSGANGVPWMDEAERAALKRVFGDAGPRVVALKEQLGENPCTTAAQVALAAHALDREPGLRAIVVNGMGAGGNFVAAVLTAR